ncbi:GHKL domain-containing protein [Hydrobacter penzbergensis]|uniref:GHKL domain-containing protein n=1 Tax=Hydrobacter penzbergensis TaxID=1235997 RepID=A0A8X8IF68_9BACT|nr:histidine kinase [Hydrobacter penzbergensis]SDX48270.1 GHKL domain-containing protein [Hydrobacter penzbergensis]
MQQKYHWLFKYKLYHIPFWFAYHIMWWTLTIGSISAVFDNIFHSAYAIKFLFYVVFQAMGVYFNLYYLMPKFLETGKYVQYILLVVFTIICVAAFIVTGYYASALFSGQTVKDLYGIEPGNYMYFFQLNTLPSSTASMTLAMSVKLTKNWIQSKKRQQLLEKEKLETELKFLKSQFNPHFLFNSINSIFVLIHKNPDIASESLAKFSDLLRYQLYECNEPHITLGQEIIYIENFIELERLRQECNLRLDLSIDKSNPLNLCIAPFILMPFIENAFKHVSKRKGQTNWICIGLHLDENQLLFHISNSVSYQHKVSKELLHYGGIGLKNVQRRLDLLYPQKHILEIKSSDSLFEVSLRLELFEQKSEPKAHTAVPSMLE